MCDICIPKKLTRVESFLHGLFCDASLFRIEICTGCCSSLITGYPNLPAAHVALETARRWLETGNNAENVSLVLNIKFNHC